MLTRRGLRQSKGERVVVGMDFAKVRGRAEVLRSKGEQGIMKEMADGFFKLVALIMLTVTLAVSTAAIAQLLG